MTRLCTEQEYLIDGVHCSRCGHCEDVYYADNQQEYELGEEDDYY